MKHMIMAFLTLRQKNKYEAYQTSSVSNASAMGEENCIAVEGIPMRRHKRIDQEV